ncbi:MAG: hypothetical protein ACR2NN_27840 [Bryobacteraceae bacterium]
MRVVPTFERRTAAHIMFTLPRAPMSLTAAALGELWASWDGARTQNSPDCTTVVLALNHEHHRRSDPSDKAGNLENASGYHLATPKAPWLILVLVLYAAPTTLSSAELARKS